MLARVRTAPACLLVAGAAFATAAATPSDDAPERLLVAAWVDGREVGTLEVLRDGAGFLVPLPALAEISGCRVESLESGTTRVTTPIGSTDLGPADVRVIDGVAHVGQERLEARLATRLSFDQEEYAIHFALPWTRDRGVDSATPPAAADIGPPSATLSTLRQDLRYTRRAVTRDAWSSTTLGGTVQGGYWRLRYEDDLDGEGQLRDYAWRRAYANLLVLAGQQSVQVHPLLGGFELTGVQAAWTDQPLEPLLYDAEIRDLLLPRRIRPSTSLDGPAPPGSLAQLRVDGTLVDETMTGLDGRYAFPDVRLPARQLSRVEVRIYDRRNPVAPIAIHEHVQSASEYLLPAGAVVHVGGLGREGNLAADRTLGHEVRDDAAGFYQWRQGVGHRVTLEGALQQAHGMRQVQAGVVSRLGAGFVASVGLAVSDSSLGYGLDLDGRGGRWRLAASSQVKPEGFFVGGGSLSDHAAEAWQYPVRRLELGLVGRHRVERTARTAFLLPAFAWTPLDRLMLRAVPNFEGTYRFTAGYRATDRDEIHWTTEETTWVDYTHRFDDGYRLDVAAEGGDAGPARRSVVLHRLAPNPRAPSFSLGASAHGGRFGAVAGVAMSVLPGVLARVDYEGAGAGTGAAGESGVLTFSLSTDLTLADRRLLPANSAGLRVDEGAIAGRLVVAGAPAPSLEGTRILVDGRLGVRTDRRGQFFVGGLEDGIHTVEIDTEQLPLELVPDRGVLTVRVAPGAATRVDFALHHEYGLCGQVRDAEGHALPRVRVELADSTGQPIAGAETDRFGWFRLDGLRAGEYRLIARASGRAEGLVARDVTVEGAFLFDQDLVFPATAR